MSRPSSGYDYTFVRVEDFDYAKEISIAETCNDSVKTLFPLKDILTTLNMCLNRISRGDSSSARALDLSHAGSAKELRGTKLAGSNAEY
jgi:hypothetical protein